MKKESRRNGLKRERSTNLRNALNQLKRANVFDVKAVMRVLELTYGRSGPKRYELLKTCINYPSPSPQPFLRKVPRTAPPRISPSLQALLSSQDKSLYPILPEPKHKPLHPRRKANIMWWHYSKIMKQVMPPVTKEELEILEQKAGKGTLSSEGLARIGRNFVIKDKSSMTLRLPNIPNMPKTPRDLVKEDPKLHIGNNKPDKNYINHPINPPDPSKIFVITKSPWADGRPIALVKKIDWKGLNPEEVENQIGDIRDINFYKLKGIGITALAFDKDNTLTSPYSNELYPPFKDAWKEGKEEFGNENIVVVSNSVGTNDDPGFTQAKVVEKSLGVNVLRHKLKKPSCGHELISHFAAHNPYTIAVIGDRMFTDVLFGNLNGMFTIFTKSIISEKRDNFMAAMVRRVEHKILDYYVSKGIKPQFHPFLKNEDFICLKKS
ncbi:9648_t:CDS:10 [Funneliformis caledonium]|uniref:9648_t:CDS:1 n=1 Tax=Funneliformis caledonium TaxID=1117310 RepID=A0A9N9GD51_9GLOM|nr:9648_t:CDS:10 [Funneliformis caledonium]